MQITRNRLWEGLDHLLFPDPCLLCRGPKTARELFICTPCLIRLPRESNALGQVEDMASRFWGLVPVVQTYAFLKFRKGGLTQQLLHAVKYGNLPQLAFQVGVWFAGEVLLKERDHFDLVVPVPLHRSKLASRGYNQSLELARGVVFATSLKLCNCLIKPHASNTQTGLSRWNRFENTQAQYQVIEECSLKDQRLLLVDDIVTTGATMAACVTPLIKSGAGKISLATAALAQIQ